MESGDTIVCVSARSRGVGVGGYSKVQCRAGGQFFPSLSYSICLISPFKTRKRKIKLTKKSRLRRIQLDAGDRAAEPLTLVQAERESQPRACSPIPQTTAIGVSLASFSSSFNFFAENTLDVGDIGETPSQECESLGTL